MIDNVLKIVVVFSMIAFGIFLWYLISRFVINVSTLTAYLSSDARKKELDALDCLYVSHKEFVSRNIKESPFEKTPFFIQATCMGETLQFVEAYNITRDSSQFFWMRTKRSKFFFPFNSRQIDVEEEVNNGTIHKYRVIENSFIVEVNEICPACKSPVDPILNTCSDCGLVFRNT